MSVEGVEKLVNELAGGSPPFRAFGESLKKELETVDMSDRPGETEDISGGNHSDPEDGRTEAEVGADTSEEGLPTDPDPASKTGVPKGTRYTEPVS